MPPSFNISARYAELEARARDLAAEGASDRTIVDELQRRDDDDVEFEELMDIRGLTRTRLFSVADQEAILASPLLTLEQKIELMENASGYDREEVDAIRAIVRGTHETLRRIVASVRTSCDG